MRSQKFNKLICIDDTETRITRVGNTYVTEDVKLPYLTYGKIYNIVERVTRDVVKVISDDNRIIAVWVDNYHKRFRLIYYTNKLKLV